MNETNGIAESNWLWGGIWIFYAFFYARYFRHMASRLKPKLEQVEVQGSPERLNARAIWCSRFAFFMIIPTSLELIRPTDFTSALISLAPCLFGLWVMRAVWKEVYRSKVAKPDGEKAKL
ncbi:hypothetical protein [Pelagicoccus sp. SDUM812003]|uniref:hypothetical protein n=1 Tax=Pelagicoccus sp. SDUM812003 TaxID=3041267 RepID=UPI00280CB586|nr:hypothetical protein [Pelagicoccus sp. SDUM812003]MDQ8203262.1 hypothetical protein [Pelagicoccus sp. SDUM812003]